jgi:chromosomal replication initiator protein
MRIKIKAPQRNSRTTFRMSEVSQLKETISHQQVRIQELERMLKMEIAYEHAAIKAAHLAIRSAYADYLPTHISHSTRKREILEPRQIFMWLIRNKTAISLSNIGKICGGRDHSTVIHACRKVDDYAATDRRYAARLETIKNNFESFAEQI